MFLNRYMEADEAENLYDLYGPTGPANLSPNGLIYAANNTDEYAERGEAYIGRGSDGITYLMVITLRAHIPNGPRRPALYTKAVRTRDEGVSYARWLFTGPVKPFDLMHTYGFTLEML